MSMMGFAPILQQQSPAVSDTGESLLAAMDFLFDGATDIVDGVATTLTSSSGHEITVGSSATAVDTNDPTLLAGKPAHFDISDTSGSRLTMPAPGLALDDAEIVFQTKLDFVSDERVVCQQATTNLLVRFWGSDSEPRLQIYWNGTEKYFTYIECGSFDPTLAWHWRIRITASNGSSVGQIALANSRDGQTWTDLTTWEHSSAFGTLSNSGTLEVGGENGQTRALGELYSFTIRDAVSGGTALVDIDAANATAGSFTDEVGNTVTVNGDVAVVPADTGGYFYMPDAIGNKLTIPATAGLALDDAEIIFRCQLDQVADWRTVMQQNFGSDFLVRFTTSLGFPGLQVTWDGVGKTFTWANLGSFDVEALLYWRVRIDQSNGSSVGEIFVANSTDGVTWSNETSQTHTSAFSTLSNTGTVEIGNDNSTRALGKLYELTINDAFSGGTAVVDIDGASAGHKTFTDGAGNTVTVNRTTTAGEACTAWVPPNTGWALGDETDDYLEFTDASFERAANGEFTMLMQWVHGGNFDGGAYSIAASSDYVPINNRWQLPWRYNASGSYMASFSFADEDASVLDLGIDAPTDRPFSGDVVFTAVRFATDGTVTVSHSLNGGTMQEFTGAGNAAKAYLGYGAVRLLKGFTTAHSGVSLSTFAANYDTALTDEQLDLIAAHLDGIYNP